MANKTEEMNYGLPLKELASFKAVETYEDKAKGIHPGMRHQTPVNTMPGVFNIKTKADFDAAEAEKNQGFNAQWKARDEMANQRIGMPASTTPHPQAQPAGIGSQKAALEPNTGITQQQYGNETIYRNDNVDHDKYGTAIFSDSRRGATQAGFDADIAQHGIGVKNDQGYGIGGAGPNEPRRDAFGNDMSLTDSYNRQIKGIQDERQGRIERTRERNARDEAKMAQAQYASRMSDLQSEAMGILKTLPFGSKGDREKRQGMLAHAKGLMSMAQGMQGAMQYSQGLAAKNQAAGITQGNWEKQFAQNQLNQDRNFGLNFLKANQNDKPEWKQIGEKETLDGTEKQFGWIDSSTQTVKPHTGQVDGHRGQVKAQADNNLVVGGYRYLGGNKNDKNNWEKIEK